MIRLAPLAALVVLLAAAALAKAAVTISSFGARWQGGAVAVKWVTASETNNIGFNILRSDTANGNYVQVNSELIHSQCLACVTGASYDYSDTVVTSGATYFYKLQSVSADGGKSAYGPACAQGSTPCSQSPTNTSTRTRTRTPTRTLTPISIPPTATWTPVPPTSTLLPAGSAATLTPTQTPRATAFRSATATTRPAASAEPNTKSLPSATTSAAIGPTEPSMESSTPEVSGPGSSAGGSEGIAPAATVLGMNTGVKAKPTAATPKSAKAPAGSFDFRPILVVAGIGAVAGGLGLGLLGFIIWRMRRHF